MVNLDKIIKEKVDEFIGGYYTETINDKDHKEPLISLIKDCIEAANTKQEPPTMVLEGKHYREESDSNGRCCRVCCFYDWITPCSREIGLIAREVFGGDCADRNVHYVKVPDA